jgi:hypothetical protein
MPRSWDSAASPHREGRGGSAAASGLDSSSEARPNGRALTSERERASPRRPRSGRFARGGASRRVLSWHQRQLLPRPVDRHSREEMERQEPVHQEPVFRRQVDDGRDLSVQPDRLKS